MKRTILFFATVVLGFTTLNTTTENTISTNETSLEITTDHIIEVYDWKVITKNGKSEGTSLNLDAAKRMITLFSAGDIELKQLQDVINNVYASDHSEGINIKSLKSKLKTDKACLVNYFYGKTGLYQFVFSPNHMTFQRIALTALNQQRISTFIDYFENASNIYNNIPLFSDDAFKLYELLKLNAISDYQNVVIIADGLLNFIPFESLLIQETTTSSYSEMPFMVKKHRLAYHTSASFYTHTKPYKFRNSALGVFPVFDNSNLKLTYSLDEAERIDDEIKTELLMFDGATKKDVLEQISEYSILHLSTHAISGDFKTPANIDL